MRSLNTGLAVATLVLTCSTLVAPLAAHADSGPTIPTDSSQTSDGWLSAESSYISHRHAIRVEYRNIVNSARATFITVMSRARTNRARTLARTALITALANADAKELSAMADLGDGPAIANVLDSSEYQLERQAINQDYADAIDTEMAAYRAEVAAATSSAELVTSRANLRLGIAQATTVRSLALVQLGSRPLTPGKSSSARGHLRLGD